MVEILSLKMISKTILHIFEITDKGFVISTMPENKQSIFSFTYTDFKDSLHLFH